VQRAREDKVGAVVARLKERAEEAERQAARLRKMVDLAAELGEEGLAELAALIGSADTNGNGYTKGTGSGNGIGRSEKLTLVRGREAVRRVVQERPGIWTLAELRAELTNRGWFTTSKGLEAAAKRLCDSNGEGRRLGPGRYVFPANHGEEDAIESDPSDGAMIPFPAR
jgi:hypothetical protein